MTYIVWFNLKYKRHFEAVVPRRVWKAYKERYGTLQACVILVRNAYRIKSSKHKTRKRSSSARDFILFSYTRPDVYGTPVIKVWNSKQEALDKGHSEIAFRGEKRYAGREKSRQTLR